MVKEQMVNIFIFDLGGVLINLNVPRCMAAFERIMGEDNMQRILGMDSRGEGVKAVSVACKQLMADYEQGLISTDTFIAELLPYCHPGTTRQDIIDAWMSMLEDLPQERLDFVDSLRVKGHPVFLLSNGNDLHFNFINETYHLASYFDGMFLSQRLHLSKPDPQIYQLVNDQITNNKCQITNDQMVNFIDDLELNRQAAEATVHWRTFPSILALKASL